jgi:hypothetical protein
MWDKSDAAYESAPGTMGSGAGTQNFLLANSLNETAHGIHVTVGEPGLNTYSSGGMTLTDILYAEVD